MRESVYNVFDKISNIKTIQALRKSLITLLPVLMLGSFALVLKSLPIKVYQDFIASFAGGILFSLFNIIYTVTFEIISIIMVILLGFYIGEEKQRGINDCRMGIMIASVSCYFILVGINEDSISAYGAKGMFTAILSATVASGIYLAVSEHSGYRDYLSNGIDVQIGNALQCIFPIAISVGSVALVNYVVLKISGRTSVHELLTIGMNGLFSHIENGAPKSILFVFLSSLLWFFGIHGSNILENVSTEIFYVVSNEFDKIPDGMIARQVLENFVLMGGCGTAVCLLISLLLFSKRNSTKNLAKIAVFPGIFNISEILVYGLPIIFNPAFLIPFLCVPVVCFIITYVSMVAGVVPMPVAQAEWTTPILLSGYIATGSIRGSLLQLFNLIVGVLIYAPFVRLNEHSKLDTARYEYDRMVAALKQSDVDNTTIKVTDANVSYSWMAKALAADLKKAMKEDAMEIFYQPQYRVDGSIIGAEALFRWKHPYLGMIYPPLVFKIAEECNFVESLEKWIVEHVFLDVEEFKKHPEMENLRTSFNLTGATIQSKDFEKYLEDLSKKYDVGRMNMCIEITEQSAIHIDDTLKQRFLNMRFMGFLLAVDDFSMGSTSVQYLTGSHFSLIKLDGQLVKQIIDNPRCYDIVISIINLAKKMNLDIIGEYVFNEKIQKKLEEAGCYMYQGGYYSMAVKKEEYMEVVKNASQHHRE